MTLPDPLLEEWRTSGREVAVVGLGKSGLAATRLLRSLGIAVYASDSGTGAAFERWAAELRPTGADVEVGRHDLERIARAQAVVVAPGVPPGVTPLEAAQRAGIPILAETDIGFLAIRGGQCIGVTGTNGKTTTTSLIAHLLTSAGVQAKTAGNIGRPLSELAMAESPPDWIALELSSFQLHDMPHFRPTVGILTNLSPNHLDRYATLEAYYADKALLFRNADADSVWISNADDDAVRTMVAGVEGRQLRFSLDAPADAWYDRSARQLRLDKMALLPRDSLPLLGDHNVANALAAALAVREAGLPDEVIAASLRTFRAIPHRMEPVRDVGGVLWVNDSKSTNVASTAVAVAALDRPFVLLLGGRHKGEPYTGLAEGLRTCRGIVAYGEAGDLVQRDLGGALTVERAADFDAVLASARRLAQPGDVVLLSPACSSYDMFANYEERGARFRAAVEAM